MSGAQPLPECEVASRRLHCVDLPGAAAPAGFLNRYSSRRPHRALGNTTLEESGSGEQATVGQARLFEPISWRLPWSLGSFPSRSTGR